MSDLRDRIANAAGDFLSDNFHAYLEQDVALELADAVIRELDSMGIIHMSRVVGCQTGPVGHEGECR